METPDLRLPDDVELLEIAGQGRRSVTYRANYRGGQVALKVYREAFIRKYRRRYDLDIAVFEHARNEAFYAVSALQPYAARPIGLLGVTDAFSLCFIQEFIDGPSLVELGESMGGLPRSVLDAGRVICREAGRAGLYDLDLFYRNLLVRRQGDDWLPVVHDFNLVPQYLFPPNPFLALAYRTGLRKKSHRDWRCLAQWEAFSEQCRQDVSQES